MRRTTSLGGTKQWFGEAKKKRRLEYHDSNSPNLRKMLALSFHPFILFMWFHTPLVSSSGEKEHCPKSYFASSEVTEVVHLISVQIQRHFWSTKGFIKPLSVRHSDFHDFILRDLKFFKMTCLPWQKHNLRIIFGSKAETLLRLLYIQTIQMKS